jgi:hypothetical protein
MLFIIFNSEFNTPQFKSAINENIVLMATAKLSSGKAMWGYSVGIGVGLGIILTTFVTAAQLSAPPELMYKCLLHMIVQFQLISLKCHY